MSDQKPQVAALPRHEDNGVLDTPASPRPHRPTPTAGFDARQMVIGVLVSVVVTGASSWFAFGVGKVDRREMEHYVETQGPYVRERQVIQEKLAGQQTTLEKISADLKSVSLEYAKTNAKMDLVLTEIHDLRTELRDSLSTRRRKDQDGDRPE